MRTCKRCGAPLEMSATGYCHPCWLQRCHSQQNRIAVTSLVVLLLLALISLICQVFGGAQ